MTAPDKLNYLRDNADGAGASIYQQSQQVTENILEAAREGLYTDYAAETDEAIILRYQAESIINWRTKRINGRDQLVLVVLRECMEKEDGFAYEDEIQYRELALENGKFVCRVWRKSADAGSFSVTSEYHPKPKGEDFWDEIPFTFVGAQNNDPTIDESPLAALVEINLGHYRNSADYEDSVFFCGQVQPVISGLDTAWRDWLQDKGIRVGSRSPFLLPKEGVLPMLRRNQTPWLKRRWTVSVIILFSLAPGLSSRTARLKPPRNPAASKPHPHRCSAFAFPMSRRPIRWR